MFQFLSTQDLNDCVYEALLEWNIRHHGWWEPAATKSLRAVFSWPKKYYHSPYAMWATGRWG